MSLLWVHHTNLLNVPTPKRPNEYVDKYTHIPTTITARDAWHANTHTQDGARTPYDSRRKPRHSNTHNPTTVPASPDDNLGALILSLSLKTMFSRQKTQVCLHDRFTVTSPIVTHVFN